MNGFFQFNANRKIQEGDDFYRNKPTISDKMHCVLFVVRADDLDEQKDVDVLCSMQNYFFSNSKCRSLLCKNI